MKELFRLTTGENPMSDPTNPIVETEKQPTIAERIEAVAKELEVDVEEAFEGFLAFIRGRKAEQDSAKGNAEQVGETSIASTDSTSNITETNTTEASTPSTALPVEVKTES